MSVYYFRDWFAKREAKETSRLLAIKMELVASVEGLQLHDFFLDFSTAPVMWILVEKLLVQLDCPVAIAEVLAASCAFVLGVYRSSLIWEIVQIPLDDTQRELVAQCAI